MTRCTFSLQEVGSDSSTSKEETCLQGSNNALSTFADDQKVTRVRILAQWSRIFYFDSSTEAFPPHGAVPDRSGRFEGINVNHEEQLKARVHEKGRPVRDGDKPFPRDVLRAMVLPECATIRVTVKRFAKTYDWLSKPLPRGGTLSFRK